MKKTIYTFLLSFFVITLYAQNKNVNKASSALEKGELAEALEWIEPAIKDEKTKDKGKTWYTRAQIYEAIATSDDEAVASLAGDKVTAVEKAVESYKKTIEIEGESSSYGVLADQRMNALWGTLLNKGASYFENQDQENALVYFELTQMVKPEDSIAYLYGGIAAQQIKDWELAKENYMALVNMDKASDEVYNTVIYIARNVDQDDEKALELVRMAREKYPTNSTFSKEEIALLLSMDRLDEAKGKLEKAIAEEPDNSNLHTNLAILYDNAYKALQTERDEEGEETDVTQEQLDEYFNKAEKSYLKAVELEPDNLVANFNLAVFYNEKANEFFKKVNAMDMKEYQKKGQAIADKGTEYIKKALPHMEKAYELQPDDLATVDALMVFYNRLKMNDKAEEMANKKDELEGGGE